jgi:hypothetical protein
MSWPIGWNFSICASFSVTRLSSTSTRRNAVIFTELYLKSSKSNVSISCDGSTRIIWHLSLILCRSANKVLSLGYKPLFTRALAAQSFMRESEHAKKVSTADALLPICPAAFDPRRGVIMFHDIFENLICKSLRAKLPQVVLIVNNHKI